MLLKVKSAALKRNSVLPVGMLAPFLYSERNPYAELFGHILGYIRLFLFDFIAPNSFAATNTNPVLCRLSTILVLLLEDLCFPL